MLTSIQNALRSTDSLVARAYLSVFRERSALLVFLFHSLFRDESEIARDLIDPLERTTVRHLRQLIEYYLASGYRFVGLDQVLDGLDPSGKYALLTFDDGYQNNRLALPVLEEFSVPAVVFVSTNHAIEQKCFWWDVLYRERTARGGTAAEVFREAMRLKVHRTSEIEAVLEDEFGAGCLSPRGEVDRPFRPDELTELARHPLIELCNHTADHGILTSYTPTQAAEQIASAQEALRALTGQAPRAIAYPNGVYTPSVLEVCRDLGLKLGFTVRPHKNRLPFPARDDQLELGRIAPIGNKALASQCRAFRSDVQLYPAARAGFLRLSAGRLPR